ncbi:hypothetical protein [Ciceribacter selenitireducens]|uniref:hypothetical protein n=1 Tax=Ciceribacter selenitireducens TaxID=448181 RepID=UPI0004B660F3|nr:hypothetical protein [Ciceribacter selenitireducens]
MLRYVAAFLTMLAVTGQIMRWSAVLVDRDGEKAYSVTPAASQVVVAQQPDAALAAVPGGSLVQHIAARGDTVSTPSDAGVSQPARWWNSATTCS